MALTTLLKDSSHTPSSPPRDRSVSFNLLSEFESTFSFGFQTIFSIMIKQLPLISFKSEYVTEPGFEHKLPDFRAQVASCWYPLQPILGLQCLLLSDVDDWSAEPTLSAGRLLCLQRARGRCRQEEICTKGSQDRRNRNGSGCPFHACRLPHTDRCSENTLNINVLT